MGSTIPFTPQPFSRLKSSLSFVCRPVIYFLYDLIGIISKASSGDMRFYGNDSHNTHLVKSCNAVTMILSSVESKIINYCCLIFFIELDLKIFDCTFLVFVRDNRTVDDIF